MDFQKVVNSLMTMGTTKSSTKSCKTIFSNNGIFQSSSLGLKLIVILQIIFIQINIHSVTGNLKNLKTMMGECTSRSRQDIISQ